MLELKDITKFYGKFCALDGLSLRVEEGALYGFVGPNGAGKTTAIRIMCGILSPDSGSVLLDGAEIRGGDADIRSRIGYVPDSFGVYDELKVSEYMEFFASCYGIDGMESRKRTEKLLDFVGLSDRADFFVDALSRGMKQRLSLARALMHDPDLLILDEPSSGLDPRTRYEFKNILSELSEGGKTIIISSHILSDIAELCTDIGIIDQGSMVMSGRLQEVLRMVTAENPIIIGMESGLSNAVKFLKAEPAVTSMAIKGSEIMINFSGDRRAETELLKRMIGSGLGVRSFSRERSSLESIFMQLTGHGEEKTVDRFDAGEEEP